MVTELLDHPVLIVIGKGGVGKTTVCAALATLAAARGRRTLVMECDRRAPMAALFSVRPGPDPVEVRPKLSLMVLDGRHALEQYIRLVMGSRRILGAVFRSRLYQFFVQAAPGLRELMMLGKIYYEAASRPPAEREWDLILLDAPASGQALALLGMPSAAKRTFGHSIVGQEARNIAAMLADPAVCAITPVTTPEPLAVSETFESLGALKRIGLRPAAVILNRRARASFDRADLNALFRRGPRRPPMRHHRHLEEIGLAELSRCDRSLEAERLLRARVHTPLICADDKPGFSGMALVTRLASDLSEPEAVAASGPAASASVRR